MVEGVDVHVGQGHAKEHPQRFIRASGFGNCDELYRLPASLPKPAKQTWWCTPSYGLPYGLGMVVPWYEPFRSARCFHSQAGVERQGPLSPRRPHMTHIHMTFQNLDTSREAEAYPTIVPTIFIRTRKE